MSLVYITYHDENIIDFDKEDGYLYNRHFVYQSKYRPVLCKERKMKHIMGSGQHKLLTSSPKYVNQTMGYAQTPLPLPSEFLRKNKGIKWRRLNDHKCPPKQKLPPVPRFPRPRKMSLTETVDSKKERKDRTESCIHIHKKQTHRINFVALNIEKIKSSHAKRPPPRYIDTTVGDSHNLINSGIIPQYICSKNFAKVPCYINVRKKFLADLNKRCTDVKMMSKNACLRFIDDYPGVRKLTMDERTEILTGLKANFAEIFKLYQGLSLYTDTVAKKLRKGRLENDLRLLEQDIFLMESNPVIYISEY